MQMKVTIPVEVRLDFLAAGFSSEAIHLNAADIANTALEALCDAIPELYVKIEQARSALKNLNNRYSVLKLQAGMFGEVGQTDANRARYSELVETDQKLADLHARLQVARDEAAAAIAYYTAG